jgi:hypothetical protein
MQMTTLETLAQIVDQVSQLPEVYSAKVWMDKRVYVNIAGRDNARAGDRNIKVYFDGGQNKWVIDNIKGCMSASFSHNLKAFAKARCPQYFG